MCFDIKIIRRVKTKKGHDNIVHTSALDYVEPINILTFFNTMIFFKLNFRVYKSSYQLKSSRKNHHQMTDIAGL